MSRARLGLTTRVCTSRISPAMRSSRSQKAVSSGASSTSGRHFAPTAFQSTPFIFGS